MVVQGVVTGDVAVAVTGSVVTVGEGAGLSDGDGDVPVVGGGFDTVDDGGVFVGVEDGRRDGVRPGVRPGDGAALAPGAVDSVGGTDSSSSGAGSFPLVPGAVVGTDTVGVEDTAGP